MRSTATFSWADTTEALWSGEWPRRSAPEHWSPESLQRYPALFRARCLTWGATPEEVGRQRPGDDLLPEPDLLATRAVTVAAQPSVIWPWLVQMGSGRGGAYTYDWIENLFGLGMHSADEILPQFQDLEVGDVLPVGPKGPRMRVEVLRPEQALVFRSEDGTGAW
jgi:hypothetical protein